MKRIILTAVLALASLPSFAATCKISEYDRLAVSSDGAEMPVAREPALAVQTVTYTTSTASAVFNAETRYVRIICDAKAHFNFTAGSTNATANSPFVAANTAEYFGLRGTGYRVEFYDGSS